MNAQGQKAAPARLPPLSFDPARGRDLGLQPERTALAWLRTALALLVNASLILRASWTSGRATLVAIGAMLLAVTAIVVLIGLWRRKTLESQIIRALPPAIVAIPALAALAACLGGILSILL